MEMSVAIVPDKDALKPKTPGSKPGIKGTLLDGEETKNSNDSREGVEKDALVGAERTSSSDSADEPGASSSKRSFLVKSMEEAASKVGPPSEFGVLILFVPMALVLFAIRYRYDQVHGEEDDHSGSSYGKGSSYSESSYGGDSSSYGSSYGDDHVSTVFVLAETIDPVETSLCFTAIIGATMTLDFLIENLNELCEHYGHVYVQLARSLYQELMLLGIISFTIFLMNAEGFFVGKTHLFHEVEYAHIVIFYLGLGLIVQGLALAIVNKEVKSVWKFSTEQTLEEMRESLDEEKTRFLGEWKLKHGMAEVKRHLDIHLVRIMFLEVMNLPTNFAYNEYVNHALDSTTLKIANNTWVTWASLIVLITGAAQLHADGIFMGTDEAGYVNFMLFGLVLVLLNVMLLVWIASKNTELMRRLGATGDATQVFDHVKRRWPKEEKWHDVHNSLRDIEQKVAADVKSKKHAKHKVGNQFKSAATKLKAAANLSSVGMRIKTLGKRVKAGDKLKGLGIDQADFARFQNNFMRCLRIANLMQAFYISLIVAHWGWYAPSVVLAYVEFVPLFFIYVALTPHIVRRYAMVMSLGKPNPAALSATIEYMEHNEQALHQVAELLLSSKSATESIGDVFDDWDTSGDGELSFKELEEAMLSCNMHMQKERLKAMWRKIDIDSSGGITKEEFCRALDPYVAVVEQENKQKEEMNPYLNAGTKCACGNTFKEDSKFCRKCGKPRPKTTDGAGASGSSPGSSVDRSAAFEPLHPSSVENV